MGRLTSVSAFRPAELTQALMKEVGPLLALRPPAMALPFQGVKGGVRLVGADQLVGVLLCGGENYLAALAGLVDHEGGLDALQAELGVPGQNRGGGVAPLMVWNSASRPSSAK